MTAAEESKAFRRINVELPIHLIERLDDLKHEWGLRSRGPTLARLLEEVFPPQETASDIDGIPIEINKSVDTDDTEQKQAVQDDKSFWSQNSEYNENKALVLVGRGELESLEPCLQANEDPKENPTIIKESSTSSAKGIDLPGFVRKRTDNLRKSLDKETVATQQTDLPMVPSVTEPDIFSSLEAANQHWISLYGNAPGETVVEAAMIWLARDIWLSVDGTDGRPFTWSAADHCMKEICASWQSMPASFERVMVVAGVLEDPFATKTLAERMPTLIRRFVNRFKRSRKVTSFQTLESTMTLHGALKLLGMQTQAGAPFTLKDIRDSYKFQAMAVHPDAGGSTAAMRRLNEAYQLLKELYREKDS